MTTISIPPFLPSKFYYYLIINIIRIFLYYYYLHYTDYIKETFLRHLNQN